MQASHLDVFTAMVSQRSAWSQRDRDAAEWRAWQCMREDLRPYGPGPEPKPLDDVVALSRMTLDQARDTLKGSESLARAFGLWRYAVTLYESECAGRLTVLASMLWALADARGRSKAPERIDAALSELGDFIATAWRTAVPLNGDMRTWTSKVTRRYDLLPAGWRELGHG